MTGSQLLHTIGVVLTLCLTTPQAVSQVHLTETFDDDVDTSRFYYLANLPNCQGWVEDGELRLSVGGEGSPEQGYAWLLTQFHLVGDFAITVDSRVITGPPPSSGSNACGLILPGIDQRNITWFISDTHQGYKYWQAPSPHEPCPSIFTSDSSATLELHRTGNQLRVFLQTPSVPRTLVCEAAHSGQATPFGLLSWRSADSDAPLDVAFDNLEITADDIAFTNLEAGLVGYWSFDEGEGGTAHDGSGNGNDGMIYGADWDDGMSSAALSFDGENDHVDMGSPATLEVTGGLTISAWIYATGPTSPPSWAGTVVSKEGEYVLARDPDGKVRYGIANDSPGWGWRYIGYECPLNTWTHIAVTYSAADEVEEAVVNGGEYVFSAFGSGDVGDYTPLENDFMVARRQRYPDMYFFEGLIDEVRIYNRALSEAEIQQLYHDTGDHLAVTGTIRFEGDDGQTHPAKYVEVSVYDDNWGVFPDEHIVTGYTGSDGSFYFDRDSGGDLIGNDDPYGGPREIYIELVARNEAADIGSHAVGLPYRGETDRISQPSGGLINFGTVVFAEANSGAFGFLAPALQAREWLEAHTGFVASSKRVAYPDANGPRWDVTAPGSIRMNAEDTAPYIAERMSEFHHEYGHGIHDEVRPGYELPGTVGSTQFSAETDEGTALSEGWATFFQTAVVHFAHDAYPVGYWPDGDLIERGAFWNTPSPPKTRNGNLVQGSVAGILWDIYDIRLDDDDSFSAPVSQIWTVWSEDDPDRMWSATADDDFYHYWTARYGETREFQEIFIDHGIAVRDDDGEDNDSKAGAFDLGTLDAGDHDYPNLICVDEDWWSFTLSGAAGAGDRVTLTFNHQRGNVDLEVYDSADQLVGASSVSGPGGSEMVSLDGQPAGTYFVKVYGNDGDYSPNYKLTISLSSLTSAVPSYVDLPVADDTGRYDSDDVTSSDLPHITGNAIAGSTVRIYSGPSGSYTLIGSGTADPGTGEYDVTVTTALSEGQNEITATAEEVGKNESEHSNPTPIVILDTQAPDAPSVPNMTWGSDTGRFTSDDITYNQAPTFEGTSDADCDITLYKGATPIGSAYTSDGEWQITADALSEGTHQVTVQATDAAGNVSGSSSPLTVTIDITPPDIASPAVSPTVCWPVGKVFDFSATITDTAPGMGDAWKPQIDLKNGDTHIVMEMTSVGGGVYQASWDSDGQDAGTWTVDFKAWDLAGNPQVLTHAASICLLAVVAVDYDTDGDVDGDDYDAFEACASGPAVPLTPGCEGKDRDGDNDVDQSDFGMFQRCYSGADNPGDPGCE